MRRRELLKLLLLGVGAAAPRLAPLGATSVHAQPDSPDADQPDTPDRAPETPSAPLSPAAAQPDAPGAGQPAPVAQPRPPVEPLPTRFAQGSVPNNIVGLNVARLHQPIYVWATSDTVNANGGDWGYITVIWTIEDREARNAEYNFQQFLDRCFEHHVQPIVRVGTRFSRSNRPGNSPPGSKGAEGVWSRPDWDEPKRWRAFFEQATWPSRHAWIIAGNEPNLGREWGGAVDAAGYARYLDHFLDTFEDTPRFGVVSGALDISNHTALPEMQDALEFLDSMGETVPGIFERLPAWASNPYRVISGGPGARYTHRAYEAEFDRIGREMPVLITEAGHLETGDEQEIARFYAEAFRDWMADPKVVAATPLFWHPDRNEFWMFELDSKNRFVYKSPTYELLRKLPRVAGSPEYAATMGNVARITPFEQPVLADEPENTAASGPASATGQPRTARTSERPGDSWEVEGQTQPATGPSHANGHPSANAEARPGQGGAPDTQTTASQTMAAQATPGSIAPPASQQAPPSPGERPVLQVTNTGGMGARLRAAPSTAADAISVLPDGATVQALGPASETAEQSWRWVRAEDGAEGWVAAELLAPADDSE